MSSAWSRSHIAQPDLCRAPVWDGPAEFRCGLRMGHDGTHETVESRDEVEVEPKLEPVYRCEHLLAQAEVKAGTKLLEQAQRIRELEQELKTMTEDRDEYRAEARKHLARLEGREGTPLFFMVWCKSGTTPPRYVHTSHTAARAEAMRLATANPGEEFFVLAEAGHAKSEDVQWSCTQRRWDEEIPF